LRAAFNLTKKVQVQLEVFPADAGTIQLNTIEPQDLPWSGTYFDGVPITLKAKAKPGYIFSHWISAANITDTLTDSLEVNVNTASQTFTAVFMVAPLPPDGPTIEFGVAPNPTNGAFILSHNNKTQAQGCTYEIYDLSGRKVLSGIVNNTELETPITLSESRAAVYILRVIKNNETLSNFKLVKY
jgi:hypothetical protein